MKSSFHTVRIAAPLALAIAGILSMTGTSSAFAQSNVQIFGTIDLNVTYSKAGGESRTALDQGGNIFPSRLGFRGTEDLGGGLAASFWIESAILADTGAQQGVAWHRRSTVSLSSATLGELRLGRDYTPVFWNVSQFAPFGTVGVAGSANIIEGYPFGVGGARTFVRTSNSIGYFLPKNLGGFYGQALAALPEGVDGTRFVGARAGYAEGPVDVAVAYGETKVANDDVKFFNVGASYNFGLVRLMGYYFDQRAENDEQKNYLLGLTAPVGPQGTFKFSIARADRSGTGLDGDDSTQLGVGYVHALSKRTALYGTYSKINNKGNAVYVTGDASPDSTPGASVSGLQIGLSHNF